MPELPDVELYVHKIREVVGDARLLRAKALTPFVLRTVSPPLSNANDKRLVSVGRLGKRIVLGFDGGPMIVVHLMVSGRFQWKSPGSKPPGRIAVAQFEFENGTLFLTEASKKRRASLHVFPSEAEASQLNPGGVEPLSCTSSEFSDSLRKENRTLKRALTNPRAFSGIGNAYSDEILWAAKLSPLRLTGSLSPEETERLHTAAVETLTAWRDRLIQEFATKFPGPGDVTAFRPDFATHGKFGQPCPACGHKIQRIVYAENETNYCAQCQNEGRVLADRALSRLLKDDWPRTLEELEP